MTDAPLTCPAIVAFGDPLPAGLDAHALLGGKGANLAEMTRALGLPVPPGFTITTEVCRQYLGGGWPAGLNAALESHLDRLGVRLGQKLGAPETPLLLSVRSGAPVSMPGMLDTVLNVGMTAAIREAMAARATPRFAADTWLRFGRMYAGVVLGVPAAELADAAASDGTPAGLLTAAERVRALAAPLGGIPTDPLEQIRGAVAAVFQSWGSERARAFRTREQIPETLGTAVTIQAMVFGNLDQRSGTGVVFTRNPATGEPGPYGDYLADAQGEDVVAGTHAVHGLDVLRRQVPAAYDELLGVLGRLERHYRDMCDVEFTVSDAMLYILQTRIGRRSPLATVRIAVAMASDPEFPLSRAEAVARVDATVLRQLAVQGTVRSGAMPLATGVAASPGVGAGVLCCDADRAAELAGRGLAVILAREETSPSDIHGMAGAAGLVTTLGGVASHAAVVARSWAIPAVTSIANTSVRAGGLQIGNTFIAEGEVVTVDGTAGALYAGDLREDGAAAIPELAPLRVWAAELGLELGQAAEAAIDPDRDDDLSLSRHTAALPMDESAWERGHLAREGATSLGGRDARAPRIDRGNDFQSAPPRRTASQRMDEDDRGELGTAGVSPARGTAAGETPAVPARGLREHLHCTLFELARTVQLKGLCTPERAAATLSTAVARVEELIAGNEALFRSTTRGIMVTPSGRSWAGEQLAAERAGTDNAALDDCYGPFSALNQRFKQLVSGWQLAAAGEQTEACWATLVDGVAAIHAELQPVIARTAGQVARLGAYARRFDEALSAMRQGDRSMLASPLKDSYHTVWFEYHEELIAFCGRDRASEES